MGVRLVLGVGLLVLGLTPLGVGTAASGTGPAGRLITLGQAKNLAFNSVAPDGTDRQKIYTLNPDKRWRSGPIDVTTDGSLIAASLGSTSERHLYTLASDGSVLRMRAGDGFFVSPSFSPTGAEIAASWRFEGPTGYVVTMGTGGSQQPYPPDTVVEGGEPQPARGRGIAWAPDGKWIAYISHSPSWDSVVLTDPAGANFQFPVSFWHRNNGGTIRSVGWSPDAAQLVFSAYDRRGIQTDLWTVDVDGSNLTQVTDTPRRVESSPDFSPDGSAVAFVVTNLRGGWSDVATMASDGSARTRLKTLRVDELQVAWGG